nr:hypothetical protein [Pandoravirus massiliensis]
MQDTAATGAEHARTRLCGEITCALARDHPSRLMRLLGKGVVRADDTIDLADVMDSLATSLTPVTVGIVSPIKCAYATAKPMRAAGSVCRSADSAALPGGPLGLVELAVFYGARRCLAFLLKAAGNALVEPNQCEALLMTFLHTRAWRHAVVCWGPCVLLRNRHRPDIMRPMVVAVGPCSGVSMRFFDPMPIVRALALATDTTTSGGRLWQKRLVSVVDAARCAAAQSRPHGLVKASMPHQSSRDDSIQQREEVS